MSAGKFTTGYFYRYKPVPVPIILTGNLQNTHPRGDSIWLIKYGIITGAGKCTGASVSIEPVPVYQLKCTGVIPAPVYTSTFTSDYKTRMSVLLWILILPVSCILVNSGFKICRFLYTGTGPFGILY